jgi:hypothetical protein
MMTSTSSSRPCLSLSAASSAGCRLQQQTIVLSEAIRHLSHELHPGVLQHAGLVAALRGGCTEVGRQHGIAVTFHADTSLEEHCACIGWPRRRCATWRGTRGHARQRWT